MEKIQRIYWPSVNLIGPGAAKEIADEIKVLGVCKGKLYDNK